MSPTPICFLWSEECWADTSTERIHVVDLLHDLVPECLCLEFVGQIPQVELFAYLKIVGARQFSKIQPLDEVLEQAWRVVREIDRSHSEPKGRPEILDVFPSTQWSKVARK